MRRCGNRNHRDGTCRLTLKSIREIEHRPGIADLAHTRANFTPAEQRTPEQVEIAKLSETLIQELVDAEVIVIGAPMYNFSITPGLKAWIDHVARAGVTF